MKKLIPFRNDQKPPPMQLVDQMFQTAEALTATVMAQREEILTAFVAKYGFHPDEAMQIRKPDCSWCVVKIDKDEVDQMRRAIILDRITKERVSRWQRFCLWAAGSGQVKSKKEEGKGL